MGTKLVGDHLSMGTEFSGTICPWGQEVGDRKSGDQMSSGPNELQPNGNFRIATCDYYFIRSTCYHHGSERIAILDLRKSDKKMV